MPAKRSPTARESSDGAPSSVLRRVLLGGLVLTVLLAGAGLFAYLKRAEPPAPSKPSPPAKSAPQTASPEAADGKRGPVPSPPGTSDPIAFAKAATEVLWTYDSRSFSRAEHVAGLKRWMTGEKKYADWESVSDQVPSPVLWSRMHDNHQHASATVGEAHFPQAFKTALAQDPGAITEAYVYAVTVTGKQTIAWQGSEAGSGAEPRSTTLAVQCRPGTACVLAGVLPSVAP
ncbi:hypothetical protein [Streptomyces sp. Ru87]|uniref:hypothetical protein n=1 Tax=Streptomyces sp. Ru87 TaxID=2044307 RepID=UPI000BF97E7E|nr:hypothetical protein [Streptomyces sp. Ru87]PGH49677.1 hypothetical protein CRI70_16080 [Streptomyces sp. Ru87]